MQTLLNTSELTFPYYLMTLEGRNLLDEAVLANLRGTTTEVQRRAFTSEFFRSAAALRSLVCGCDGPVCMGACTKRLFRPAAAGHHGHHLL